MYVILYFQGREIDRMIVDSIEDLRDLQDFEFKIVDPEEKQWYATDLHHLTVENDLYRHVVKTGKFHQIVLMTLKPGEDIGMEVHPDTDQFIRIEGGRGKAIIDGDAFMLQEESAINIEAGSKHNIVNTGDEPLKLYTIYSPPHHSEGLVQPNKP